MPQCHKCKCVLNGDWELNPSSNQGSSRYGRFLGVDGYFFSTQIGWVYSYCKDCFTSKYITPDTTRQRAIAQLSSGIAELRDALNNARNENERQKEELRALRERDHIYKSAKENIYELPELCELQAFLKDLSKEDTDILSQSGLNCDIVKRVEEKQKSMTLEVIHSFKKEGFKRVESHLSKLHNSLKPLKEFYDNLESSLCSVPLVAKEAIKQTTKDQITELEEEISKWEDYKLEFATNDNDKNDTKANDIITNNNNNSDSNTNTNANNDTLTKDEKALESDSKL